MTCAAPLSWWESWQAAGLVACFAIVGLALLLSVARDMRR